MSLKNSRERIMKRNILRKSLETCLMFNKGKVLMCKNCSKYFEADDDSSCYFHPGKLVSDGLRTSNFYDELRYECCGKIQKGFNPILEEPKGCKMNKKHVRL